MATFALLGLFGCATSGIYPRMRAFQRQYGDPPYLGLLWQGCVSRGMPVAAVQAALGDPQQVAVDARQEPRRVVWTYWLEPGGARLTVEFLRDTVERWEASIRHERWVPKPQDKDQRAYNARITDYLDRHPEVSDRLAYAMYQGCAMVGMDTIMVNVMVGTEGRRSEIHYAGTDSVEIRWVYRAFDWPAGVVTFRGGVIDPKGTTAPVAE